MIDPATPDTSIYQRPADYDLEHANDDTDARFYGQVLRGLHPERVLELACGTGRILARLADHLPGAQLCGVDDSPEMLERAQRTLDALPPSARERLTLARGDMRSWRGGGAPFDAVLIGGRSASHLLSLDDRRDTWRCVYDLLRPGGAFLMDVSMPDLATLAESQRAQPRALLQLDVDASQQTATGAVRLMRSTATAYDPHLQQARVCSIYDRFDTSAPDTRFVTDFTSHVYFPCELELLFASTGFEIVQRYGDYSFSPLSRSSPYLITLARRPAGPD